MSIINSFSKALRPTAKQLVIGGVFALAFAGAVGLGLQARQYTSASVIRDDAVNSIDNADANGGIGAADASEFIKDVKDNKPSDLATIYSHFGLTSSKYDEFAKNAKNGTLYRDGRVVVNGQTVMIDALTMGRTDLGKPASERKPVSINGKTYYQSTPEVSFAKGRESLPVMVMFDDKGIAQTVVMNACGNPVQGKPSTPKATCDALDATQDKTNPNKFSFTARASFVGNAKLQKVVYTFSDTNTSITKTSLTDAVDHTFAKDGKVTVTVYATVPGGAVISTSCEKQVKHTPPMAVCTALVASALDDQKQKFRFTVKVATDKNTTVKNADFTVDANTTTGVTTKDGSGNIYKDYTFTDDKEHTIKATVYFTTQEGVKTATCAAKVTSKKTPMCTVPGHENEKPDSETCGYCKQDIPKGDARCADTPQVLGETTVLPNTGAGNLVGAFAGTSALGAAGHFFYSKRRASRAGLQG
jgi:LPXTG-motif cell wall-anchored protein